MKLIISFGHYGTKKEIQWHKNVMDFPKRIQFNGKKWEWVFYNGSETTGYELTFGEMQSFDPNYNTDIDSFESIFGWAEKCECGAIYTSFSWDHMKYCPMWKSWK